MSSITRAIYQAGMDGYRGAPPDFYAGLKVKGVDIEELIARRPATSSDAIPDIRVLDLAALALANDTQRPMLIDGVILILESASPKSSLTLDGAGTVELGDRDELTRLDAVFLLAPGETLRGTVKGKATGRLVIKTILL